MQYRPVTIWLPRLRLPRRVSLRNLLVFFSFAAIAFGWFRDHQRLRQENLRLKSEQTSWGVNQLLGPPNAVGSSDNRNAWASATQDGQAEWVVVDFASAFEAAAVVVYENYNPGAVTKVTTLDGEGRETTIWEGVDPTPSTEKRGVSELAVAPEHPVRRIKIYLDSQEVPGWNEIDAVGLRDKQGQTHWAQDATVSSAYGGAPTRSWRMTFTF